MAKRCEHAPVWMNCDGGTTGILNVYACDACGEYQRFPPSNDTGIETELLLADVLAEDHCLYEPGEGRDAANEGAIEAALIVIAVADGTMCAVHGGGA